MTNNTESLIFASLEDPCDKYLKFYAVHTCLLREQPLVNIKYLYYDLHSYWVQINVAITSCLQLFEDCNYIGDAVKLEKPWGM